MTTAVATAPRRNPWIAPVVAALCACSAADTETGRRARAVETGAGAAGAAGAAGIGAGPAGAGTGGVLLDPMATSFARDDSDMAGLDPGVLEQLRSGTPGEACTLVYPYQNTKFPDGIASPPIMWSGGSDAAYAQVRYDNLNSVDYAFAQGASDPAELRIPQDAWDKITHRTRSTALRVTLRSLSGGRLAECELVVTIAPGKMSGAIYYNTYNAPGVLVPGNGAVMRLTLGEPQAQIYLQYDQPGAVPVTGPCVSCHSVSFDGSVIVASTHNYLPFAQSFLVSSYALSDQAQPPAMAMQPNANFGALTPDGTRILATGNPDCTAGADTFPRSPNNFPLVEGPAHARLLDTANGQELPAAGLDSGHYMWMPQFSPAGDQVVFNHARSDGLGGTIRRELAVASFDAATNTFGAPRTIVSMLGPTPSLPYTAAPAGSTPLATGHGGCAVPTSSPTGNLNPGSCAEPCYPAYPFFTPDGKAVVFALTSTPDFTTAFPGRDQPAKSELWYADLETGKVIPLENANRTLDPTEGQLDHYPTVMPVAVGGYFWMFWTSRRSFGHHDTGGVLPGTLDPMRKRIWAAALKPHGSGDVEIQLEVTDPSFPGFYLEGQSESGNVRAFASLNPCVPKGTTCTSGLDCCDGFCKVEPGASEGTCTDEVPECSKTNEKCRSDADCCPPASPAEPMNTCLAGYCGFITVE